MIQDIYPLGPKSIPAELTKPSTAYKHRAWLAVASLALFLVLYLALAVWFVWTAYRMFGAAAAGGPDVLWHALIAGSAAFLALFMLKALFFIERGGPPDAVEVTKTEQPRLFAFLYRLADEAGAPRPHKVYLSARVNAAVFYDLSVLNLVFPSRKNLEIGLSLVNVLTLSEMKAVLAHEFGHFAQRSMAIGSWVYIAQQIASHVVAKRDALDKLLQFISNVDLRIAWVGWLLSLVVWSIRSLMDTLLRLVVLAQRALSRQMEFQADLVAVSLTGSDEIVHALHKLQAADDAWEQALGFCNAEIQRERLPHDLFAVQTRIVEKMAQILNDETYGRTPPAAANPQSRRVFKSAFAQPPQMWSTHPSSFDREENAKRRYLAAPPDTRSAWLLFDNAEAVKTRVVQDLIGEVKAKAASAEETFQALDERYALRQYEPRYRGAYLGRALTRHAVRPGELYEEKALSGDAIKTLTALYPQQLADDLTRWRELEEERTTLQALRDKVYQATGGRIVHRGREISRRDLPAAIRDVAAEIERVRERILTHDRRCRGAHLAAAGKLGAGWREYLVGLIGVLHYAEHTLADLRDAQGLLGNVVAVVTADGKVTSGELKRLISVANMLFTVLENIHKQKAEVQLDSSLLTKLQASSWPEMLEEFKLTIATETNINEWMRVIDGWVNAAAASLSSLRGAALEQLLHNEDEIARHLREQTVPQAAPAPSRLPAEYPTLLEGKERKRQERLGPWDRFQTADGLMPGLARLLVAGMLVGAVLGFGSMAGVTSSLSVYNGLGRDVQVVIGKQRYRLAPYSSTQADIETPAGMTVEASTTDGRLIERFNPPLTSHANRYVYNVAGASPLVEWTAVYGSATEQPPRFLGAPRWTTSYADVLFSKPPESVRIKGSGTTRLVLSGFGDRAPDDALKMLKNSEERKQVIAAHARWDSENAPNAAQWRTLAGEGGSAPVKQSSTGVQ